MSWALGAFFLCVDDDELQLVCHQFRGGASFVARGDVAFGPLSLAPAWADQESMERVRVRPGRNAKVFPPENPIDGTKHCQNCGLTCF